MENTGIVIEPTMDLLPGFRFHPTDEELITHYLTPKIMNVTFSARAIGEVDLNKCEPWDLPKRAKMGEKELYFFCVRDRKYPSGLRTNRATEAGYWKATGKDREICRGKSLVGMKKTLVFYKGRAPKGHKSNWVMHEFRQSPLSSNAQNEWVICRIFHKSSSGKKIPFQGLIARWDTLSNEFNQTKLPPLMEAASPYNANFGAPHHVSCFSTSMEIPQTSHYQTSFDGSINNNNNFSLSTNPYYYPLQTGEYSEQNIVRAMIDNGAEMKTEVRNYSASQDTCFSSDINTEISSVISNYDLASSTRLDAPSGPSTSTSAGPVDLSSLWNF